MFLRKENHAREFICKFAAHVLHSLLVLTQDSNCGSPALSAEIIRIGLYQVPV